MFHCLIFPVLKACVKSLVIFAGVVHTGGERHLVPEVWELLRAKVVQSQGCLWGRSHADRLSRSSCTAAWWTLLLQLLSQLFRNRRMERGRKRCFRYKFSFFKFIANKLLDYKGIWVRVDGKLRAQCCSGGVQRKSITLRYLLHTFSPLGAAPCMALRKQKNWADKMPVHRNLIPAGTYFDKLFHLQRRLLYETWNWVMSLITLQTAVYEMEEYISLLLGRHF